MTTNVRELSTSIKLLEPFPKIEPFKEGYLTVSDRHTIYWEQCGQDPTKNSEAKHVIILHGGPGAGCNAKMRSFHNPEKYCITLFDQRGAGKSTPYADCEENTTWDLVSDIEKLRKHLNIDKWQVFGGSWGATLALAYSQTHPEVVTEIILRGVFGLRRWELDFFYQEGASRVFADAWDRYISIIPEEERGDMMAAYHKRLFGTDEKERLIAAKEWSRWEGACCVLEPNYEQINSHFEDKFALAFSRIENHYFINKGFFKYDGQLIKEAKEKLGNIPGCHLPRSL